MKVFIKKIKVEDIDFDTHQPRQNFREDKIKDLSENIAEFGLLIPIEVTPYVRNGDEVEIGTEKALGSSERRWWLIDGARRLKACEPLVLKEVDAKVRMDLSVLKMRELQLVMNAKRLQVSPQEMAKFVEAFKEEALKKNLEADWIQRLMKLTGFSRAYFGDIIAINESPEPLREKIFERKVAPYLAGEIKKCSKDPGIRQGLVDVALEIAEENKKMGANTPRILGKAGDTKLIEKSGAPVEERRQVTKELIMGYMRGQNVQIGFSTAKHKVNKLFKEFLNWNMESWTRPELDIMASLLLAFSDHLREVRRLHNKL